MKTQNRKNGYQFYLADKSVFELLKKCDSDMAEKCRQVGCTHCFGTLHRADYKRKPRGGPADLEQAYRDSFCCAVDGCRKTAHTS